MLMCYLSEYSDNHSMKSENLWNFYKDQVNDSANEIDDNYNKINNGKTTTSKSFEYKTKIIRSTPKINGR